MTGGCFGRHCMNFGDRLDFLCEQNPILASLQKEEQSDSGHKVNVGGCFIHHPLTTKM